MHGTNLTGTKYKRSIQEIEQVIWPGEKKKSGTLHEAAGRGSAEEKLEGVNK